MSTRSRIAIQNKDLSITSIYCHHDGYIQKGIGVAYDLKKHYKSVKKINHLMDLGSISSLGERVEKGSTRAYGRDLNGYQRAENHKDFQDLWAYYEKEGWDEEYLYLFKDKQWYYVKSENTLIPLSELL